MGVKFTNGIPELFHSSEQALFQVVQDVVEL
jgi:hypothetical protein